MAINRKLPKEKMKDMLSCDNAVRIDINDFNRDVEGRLCILVNGYEYETCVFGSKVKKLYIFLSAVGKSGVHYPLFNRVMWSKYFDGVCLYLDDPTRNEKKYAPCYYFGSRQHNCIDDISYMVKQIAKVYGISSSDICFISSSNGGTASLLIADRINGAKSIVFNPQINVSIFNVSCNKKIDKVLNIDFNDKKYFDRFNVIELLGKIDNQKFFIFFNTKCEFDKEQYEYFMSHVNAEKISHGLFKIGNGYCLAADIDYEINPHLAQPDEVFTAYIDNFLDGETTRYKLHMIDMLLHNMRILYEYKYNVDSLAVKGG